MSLTAPPMGYWRRWRVSMLMPALGVLGLLAVAVVVPAIVVMPEFWPVWLAIAFVGCGASAAGALGVARTSLGAHSVRTAYGSVWCLMLLWWLIGAALGVVVVTVLQWKEAAGLSRFRLVALAVALLVLAVAASAMDPVLKTKLKASEIRPGQVVTPARLHFWQMSWKSAAIGVVEFADQHGQKRYAVTLPDSDGSADERVEEGFVLFDVTSPERPHRFVQEFDPNA
ncbi:hypothetical protein [Agrococcus casei]|uniref:hypothetical protein n=1 Tax=Agrococcus casei TaxID=343512 RepID=UPI003F9335A2